MNVNALATTPTVVMVAPATFCVVFDFINNFVGLLTFLLLFYRCNSDRRRNDFGIQRLNKGE